jgi:D-sedoheptulose 7-phosphate isomerase
MTDHLAPGHAAPDDPGPGPAVHDHGGDPACSGDTCITCADIAVPVRVTALRPGRIAQVDTGSGIEEISVALVDARIGDVVLVHAKEAIAVLDPPAAPRRPDPSEPPTRPGASHRPPAPPTTSPAASSRGSSSPGTSSPGASSPGASTICHATSQPEPGPKTDTAAELTSLYPFLYASGGGGIDAVIADVSRSTAAKAREIVALREQALTELGPALAACAEALAGAFRAGGTLFAFGNGGSSTDAQAVAQLFLAPPRSTRGPASPEPAALPAMALTSDAALVTALSNDVGFEVVFARQLAALGTPGDIALALSTSGGSRNVLAGLAEARRCGMVTVGFAGYDGGAMAKSGLVDHLFVVPSSSVHRIQETQTTLCHVLWELVGRAHAETP